jgi:L-lactate dehydrogenase complex protein LldG
MASARETILYRIRRATRDVPEEERPKDVSLERGYREASSSSREEIVERFAERAAEYEATVRRVKADELPGAIEESLRRRSVERLVVPPHLPKEWIPEGIETLREAARPRLAYEDLDGGDGVLTGAAPWG